MTYEPPEIAERAEVGGPLIGQPIGSPSPISPAWRPTDDGKADTDD